MTVTVPAALAGRVAEWVLAGVRAELALERERGGAPFPTAPYLQLVRALRGIVADGGHETSTDTTTSGQLVTTDEWARRYGRSGRSVRRDCLAGRVAAIRVGHVWLIDTMGVHDEHSGTRTAR